MDDNIKHLTELNKTMAETQTWVERLKIGFSNFINDSTIGNFITSFGIGRGSLGDLAAGVSLIKGTGTTIGNVFGKKGFNVVERMRGTESGAKILKELSEKGSNALVKGKNFAKSFGKKIPYIGALLSAGMLAKDASDYESANPEEKEQKAKDFTKTGASIIGGTLGGIIGTAILPGIGTAVGAIVGGLAGELVTYIDPLMKPITDAIIPILDDLSPYIKDIKDFFSGALDWIKKEALPVLKKFGKKLIELQIWWFGVVGKIFGTIIHSVRQVGTLVSGITKGALGVLLSLDGIVHNLLVKATDFFDITPKWFKKLGEWKEKKGGDLLSSSGDSFKGLWENQKKAMGFDSEENSTKNLPSHRFGLPYVPKDDYLARLHKGEMVLTRSVSDVMRGDVYSDLLKAAAIQAKGGTPDLSDVVLKFMKRVNKDKISPTLLDYILSGMNTNDAKTLFDENDIGTVMIISGHRTIDQQNKLAKNGRGVKNSAHLVGKAVDYNFITRGGNWLTAWKNGKPNPKYEQIYDAFGDIIENISGGVIRNGANFAKKDINHMEMIGAGKDAAQVRYFLEAKEIEEQYKEKIREYNRIQMYNESLPSDEGLASEIEKINMKKEEKFINAALDEFERRIKRIEKLKKQAVTGDYREKIWQDTQRDVVRDPYSYGLTSVDVFAR